MLKHLNKNLEQIDVLLIDCDDTLVIYQDSPNPSNPFGALKYGTPWVRNDSLIDAIQKFEKKHPNTKIIIWTGGGKDYATLWKIKFFANKTYEAMAKFSWREINPELKFVAIDDQWEEMSINAPSNVTVVSPDTFINFYE